MLVRKGLRKGDCRCQAILRKSTINFICHTYLVDIYLIDMKDNSQTQFALLGLLQLGPMSGYDLKQMVDQSIAHFWREGWGRIYPTLRALEKAGMVAKRTERKRGRPERNVYTIRPEGRKRLREWLSRDWAPEVYRNEMLLKLFLGRTAGEAVAEGHVTRFREQCAAEIATYEAILKVIEIEAGKGHPDAPFWKMTVSYGLHSSHALKAWAEETLSVLKGQEKRE
jgi:PadR family transcriptional regulator, regulatory protein AphA